MPKNIFTFLKNKIGFNKVNRGNNVYFPVTTGSINYRVRSEDVSEMDKIIKETYDLLKEVKKKKSELSEEKLNENIQDNRDLADFLNNDIIEMSNNYYKNLQLIQDDFKDLNLHKNEIFSEKNNKYKEKYKKYLNAINKSNASHILKLDVYDKNIEDNIYIMYYLLSYGVIGMFIFKLLYK